MSSPVIANSGSQEEEKKCDFVNHDEESGLTFRMRQTFDPAMDQKQFKQLVSNSVASRMERWKKQQYVEELEKKIMELNTQVNMLRYQVEMAIEQNRSLEREQMELNECISARLQRCINVEGEIEANIAEIERLKKKMATLN